MTKFGIAQPVRRVEDPRLLIRASRQRVFRYVASGARTGRSDNVSSRCRLTHDRTSG